MAADSAPAACYIHPAGADAGGRATAARARGMRDRHLHRKGRALPCGALYAGIQAAREALLPHT